jgi:RND family efflux transporter MFP subunit
MLTAVLAVACRAGGAQEAGTPEPVSVRVAEVVQERVSPVISATGTLGPKDEIALSFKIGGVIERIMVDAAESVAAGQTLATLDLREIDAAVMRAQSAASKAERDLARARRLYADSVVALAQLQDAETAAELAGADLELAKFNRRYAVITSPAAGVILRRHAEAGEMVAPGAVVLELGSRAGGAVVRVGLSDRDAMRVRVGTPAEVRFDALPDRTFAGRITEMAAAAEPSTGTYEVEITVVGAAHLAAGLVAEVEVRPTDGVLAAIVPVEAILEADGADATVFALAADGTRAERRRVRVAWLDEDRVALLSGLEGVRAVVTDGAAWLADGDAVRVVQ